MERLVDLLAQGTAVVMLGGLLVVTVIMAVAIVAVMLEEMKNQLKIRKNRRSRR